MKEKPLYPFPIRDLKYKRYVFLYNTDKYSYYFTIIATGVFVVDRISSNDWAVCDINPDPRGPARPYSSHYYLNDKEEFLKAIKLAKKYISLI